MALPDVKQTIKNRGLGILPDLATGVHVKVGPSSAGNVNEVVQVNDKAALIAKFGVGPLVESAAFQLETAGGPIICIRTPSSTPGAAGSVTKTGTGTGTMTAPGAALDDADVLVEILTGGATLVAGTSTFRYSVDGGKSYSPTLAVPTGGTYLIAELGITLTFAYTTGVFTVAGDKWSFSTSAPRSSQSEIMAAVDAALADPSSFSWIHVVGPSDTVANSAGMFAALDTKLVGAETTSFRYLFGIIEVPQDTDTNIKTAFASVASDRVSAAAGMAYYQSALSYGKKPKRSAAWAINQRLARIDPGQDAAAVEDGSLIGVDSLVRDEQKTPGLDDARFSTLRSFVGMPGFYVSNARIMSLPGTDFELIQHRRCMDIACRINRTAMLRYLSAKLRVDRATGRIQERTARAIESDVGGQLEAALVAPGDVSAVMVTITRTDNILSEKVLRSTVAIVPHGYAKQIESTLSFFNPALAPSAAV